MENEEEEGEQEEEEKVTLQPRLIKVAAHQPKKWALQLIGVNAKDKTQLLEYWGVGTDEGNTLIKKVLRELEAPLDNLKVFNTVKKIPKDLVEELRVVARGVRDSHLPW